MQAGDGGSRRQLSLLPTRASNEGYPRVSEDFTITVKARKKHSVLNAGGPSRGLLRDCEIFGNLHITFVSSSTADNVLVITDQRPGLVDTASSDTPARATLSNIRSLKPKLSCLIVQVNQ